MHPLVKHIRNSNSLILSTHTQPDGDGIGSQLALYWALKKAGKDVRIINVDEIPKKYDFLDPHHVIETISRLKKPLTKADLSLIFDTNDPELLRSLWGQLKKNCSTIVFVDHHPILDRHPLDLNENLIDIEASSTGQIVFNLIKDLQIPLDAKIATPIYASIVFDTNYFRYIRNSPTPHHIAAELLSYNIDAHLIHRHLFGNHTPNKLKFLSQILGQVEYELQGRLALVRVGKKDIASLGLENDETRDIIDMIMNVETIEAAALFREEDNKKFKLSFRSKGGVVVSDLAQNLGGGGHRFASGASVSGTYESLKGQIIEQFSKLFGDLEPKAASS